MEGVLLVAIVALHHFITAVFLLFNELQSQSHPLSTDDPNAIVTTEEVRKAPDGSITIHRYLRGKLLGKVGQC
jgi:hypothetical protein